MDKSISYAEDLAKKWTKWDQEKINPKLEKNKENFAKDIKKKSVTQDQKTMEEQVIEHYNEYIEKLKWWNPEEISLAKEQLELSHKKWTEARWTENEIAIQTEAANNIAEWKTADTTTEVGKAQQQMEAWTSWDWTWKLMKVIKAMNPFGKDAIEFGNALKEIVFELKFKWNLSKVIRKLLLGMTKSPEWSVLEKLGWFVHMGVRIGFISLQAWLKITNKEDKDSIWGILKDAAILWLLRPFAMILALCMYWTDFKLWNFFYEWIRKATQWIWGVSEEWMHEIAERLWSFPWDN